MTMQEYDSPTSEVSKSEIVLASELSLDTIAEIASGEVNRNALRTESIHWQQRIDSGYEIEGSGIGFRPIRGEEYPWHYKDRSKWDLYVRVGEDQDVVERFGAVVKPEHGFVALISPISTEERLRGFLITDRGVQRLISAPSSVYNPDFLRAGQLAAQSTAGEVTPKL